jgi:hypothetical protein
MLQYYLRMQPELFTAAVEQQLTRLKEDRDARAAAAADAATSMPPPTALTPTHPELDGADGAAAGAAGSGPGDLVLYKRMEEVRAREVRATLEDLMYVSILEKFLVLGVDMLPRLDGGLRRGRLGRLGRLGRVEGV